MGKIEVIIPPSGVGGGNVTTSGLTVNKIPRATTATNIENSIISQTTGSSVQVGGTLDVTQNLISRRYTGNGSVPTATVAAAAGVGATVAIVGNDVTGLITVTFGVGVIANAAAVNVVYGSAYTTVPSVIVTFCGYGGGIMPAALSSLFMNEVANAPNNFTLNTPPGVAPFLAGSIHQYRFWVIQ